MAQAETAKIVTRCPDPEREVWPTGCQQRPHFVTDPEIDGMREGVPHDAATRAINVERVAD
jgi:hypothetical protein